MSYHPYRVRSIDDETRYLQEMLRLEDKVRLAKENEMRLKSTQNNRYAKMFQPVTNTLKQLRPVKTPLKVETSTSTDSDAIHPDNVSHESVAKDPADEFDENEGPGDLFRRVLQSIPERSRDDGVFGLDVKNHRIGDYGFEVNGNELYVYDPDSNDPNDSDTYTIDDPDTARNT